VWLSGGLVRGVEAQSGAVRWLTLVTTCIMGRACVYVKGVEGGGRVDKRRSVKAQGKE
jgi:hypothetical protein